MGGVQMKRLLRTHVVVVFGATSRIGKATVEALTQAHEGITVVLAVERPKDPRVRRLRRATGSETVQCDFANPQSLQRVVRHADAVLLVPALSPSGTQFSKRVLDACATEDVARIVLISSLLATDDYWRQENASSLGYEAIEAHARNVTNNCVALRIPLLMEALLYCRDEVIFANRFFSCFQPDTPIPCIAVHDVARAACEVLTKPAAVKFHATYSLANADVSCSPVEIGRLLSVALGRTIKAKYVSDDQLTHLLKDKGVSDLVAINTIRMKNYLELTREVPTPAVLQTSPEEAKASLPLTRVGYSNDYRTLTKRALTTPSLWLNATRVYFERSAENQMQLFVMGAGEGLFQEIERLVAQQVTAPLAAANPPKPTEEEEVYGEATIPTATGSAVHSKATFCTIKTVPGGRQRQQTQLHAPPTASSSRRRSPWGRSGRREAHAAESEASPMVQLLAQLTSADVVVFVPPLRFGAAECMDVLRVVIDAARRAKAWGIVVVSSVFTGRGWADSVNRMGEMEQLIESSGVPYAIVRLPLFMEYFLALSPPDALAAGASTTEEIKEIEPEPASHPPSTSAPWPLLGHALASTPQYMISTADAAKALVSVAYTFPLHRNKIRTVYTERRTMHEIEQCFQQYAYKHARFDFSRIDALRETPRREFWRVAYWPKAHVKQFFETEVALSGHHTGPLVMAESFEDLTECPPITLEKWTMKYAKSLAQTLTDMSSRRERRASTEETKRPTLERTEGEMELIPAKSERENEMRSMKMPVGGN